MDHGLRPESEEEAFQVSKSAIYFGFETIIRKINWDNFKPSKSEAMAQARIKRYKILYEECIKNKTPILLTGHHLGILFNFKSKIKIKLDDVIETFLIRLLRASGLDGLSCIHPFTFLQPG